MCGFLVSANFKNFSKQQFLRSLNLLSHRGPDQSGHAFVSDYVVMGFQRLAIQDLSEAGMQPMSQVSLSDPNKRVSIVFNGEIYNFQSLRKDLIAGSGDSFNTCTDTEVILKSYLHWGWGETLRRIEGMFAIVIFDELKNRLFLARDMFGQKPLFFTLGNAGQITVASEIKALIGFVPDLRPDKLSILNPVYTTGMAPRGRTFFEKVSQLNPGESGSFDLGSGKLAVEKFFDLKHLVSEGEYNRLAKMKEREILEEYQAALSDSVQSHLVSDAPLGSMLSGGVDSLLVTELANRSQEIHGYYWESEKHNFPKETGWIEKRFSMTKVKGLDGSLISTLPRLTYHYETVNKYEGVALGELSARARDDGIKALLSGDGSEELFGQAHYPTLYSQAKNSVGLRGRALRSLAQLFGSSLISEGIARNAESLTYFMGLPYAALTEIPLNCLLRRGERLEEWIDSIQTFDFLADGPEKVLKSHVLDELRARIERFMIRSDRYGMMNSVEIRNPFLDKRLVRLALNTPSKWHLKKTMRGYVKKYVIKELAIQNSIPREIAYRKKLGTPVFFETQLSKVLGHWNIDRIAESLDLSPETLRGVALNSFDPNITRFHYAVLSSDLLIRMFVDQQPHEQLAEELSSIVAHR